MPELEKLRQMLADMNLQAVARGAGVHPNVLYRIMAGGTNPRYETVQRVMNYLTKEPAQNG
jgi:predicted transcriptional regulator